MNTCQNLRMETERQKRKRRERERLEQADREEARERREEDGFETLLFGDIVLSFEERLERLAERWRELDRASLEALRAAEIRSRQTWQDLEALRQRATVVDGERVYRSQDGRAFTEAGQEIDPAGIAWRENAPTWEQHLETTKAWEDAARERQDIEEYRDRLEKQKERLDGPLTEDDLREIESELEDMPDAVRQRLSGAKNSAAHEYMGDDPFPSAPDTTAHFAVARQGQEPSPERVRIPAPDLDI